MNKVLLALLALVLTSAVQARTLTAVRNGNWKSSSTWSPAVVPAHGDLIMIPVGTTVYLMTNENNMKNSTLDIRVAGFLKFQGNGSKLWISGQSKVFVYTHGKIVVDENSQGLIIGNSTVLNGPQSGVTTVTGPSVATATGSTNNLTASNAPSGFAAYNPASLPVKFIAFTAVRRSNDVLVQWSTAEEVDALSYDVEMSTDGRNWSSLVEMKAAGNSSTTQSYSYTARNLPAGTVQFRVKQVDISGKYTYTAVRSVKGSIDASIQLSAVSGKLVASFGQEVKGATIRIMNSNGQVLQEQKLSSAIGQVLVPTSVKGLAVVAILYNNEIAASRQLIF